MNDGIVRAFILDQSGLTLNYSSVSGFKTESMGGALNSDTSDVFIFNSQFSNNSAMSGGALALLGEKSNLNYLNNRHKTAFHCFQYYFQVQQCYIERRWLLLQSIPTRSVVAKYF